MLKGNVMKINFDSIKIFTVYISSALISVTCAFFILASLF